MHGKNWLLVTVDKNKKEMKREIKRILLVAYNFPPLITPQSLRWFYLTRELSNRGYRIDVLTIKMPERFTTLMEQVPETVKTHPTFPGPLYFLIYKFSREPSQGRTAEDSDHESAAWNFLSKINSGIYAALNFVSIPDTYSEWMPFAVKKGTELLNRNKYDLIISSSDPRVSHLVAYRLKKKTRIPWIADYGDPWIYTFPTIKEGRLKKRIIKNIENRILKEVDIVTVATDGAKRFYLAQYPFISERNISVIPQGFDPEEFSGVEAETSSKFRIVYCGSLYRDLRDPTAFFEAVDEIDSRDIEVIIAGRINEFTGVIREDKFHRKIRYLGFLDHRECLKLQKGAAVLLHIGNASEIQVPGKIYEYIGARRPILAIKGTERDLSADLTTGYNKGLVVENNKKDIKNGIMNLYSLWRDKSLEQHFNLDTVHDFSWQRQADTVCDIIRGI
jgi:glycosyltransferase involved in cell wall biosynthesis